MIKTWTSVSGRTVAALMIVSTLWAPLCVNVARKASGWPWTEQHVKVLHMYVDEIWRRKKSVLYFFLILALRLGRYIVWLWCTCYRGECRLWCCCKSSSYHFFPTLGCLPFAWVSHLGMIEKCYPHRSHKKNNVDQTKFLNKLLDKSRMIWHSCINFWEYKIDLFIFCKWDLYMCKLNEKESNLFCF